MGIKGLKSFLRDRDSKAFPILPLASFRGKIIAIDFYNWLFTYLNVVYKSIVENSNDPLKDVDDNMVLLMLIDHWLKFNMKLFKFGIIPLWIKDGKSKQNKAVTQKERRKTREKTREKRDNLKKQLEEMNPLERPPELEKSYRKIAAGCAYISYKGREKFFDFIFASGIPAIEAIDEAENLACSLFVERKIHFIWSADTDCCALEGDFIVKKFSYDGGKPHFESMMTSIILRELKMDKKQFRDFCILLGTDFNSNPALIGPVRALKLIRTYGSLEKIDAETQHLQFIKYKEIREQLTPYKTGISIDQLLINKDVNYNVLTEYTDSVHLAPFYNDMIDLKEPHIKYINYLEKPLFKSPKIEEIKVEEPEVLKN
jgi:flap endonuclease-1